jgi:thiamine kinase-like enzyme
MKPADVERERVRGLRCWGGPVEPEPIAGGISNHNFLVVDRGARFFVRVGDDLPVHGVVRANELRASRAAHAAGVAPEVVYAEESALVLRYLEGRALTPQDVPMMLERIVPLIATCHASTGRALRGPALMFWVFHSLEDYGATLSSAASPHVPRLPDLLARARVLEREVGAVDLVFGHNDLLAANIIDDGRRLWLVDWEYAGYNSPLFDLAGLASNNGLAEEDELRMLALYFGRAPDAALVRRYRAMKCASLLRESMWSMASEIASSVSFDYAAYTALNLARFERAWSDLERYP